MSDVATARADILAKVEMWAPGQGRRFAPVLDELIRWSEENAWGLKFTAHTGMHQTVKFCVPGVAKPFWAVVARSSDGAKLSVLPEAHPRFAEELRDEARRELAAIEGVTPEPGTAPSVAFTKLIWAPYRQRVLDLLTRLLNGVHGREPAAAAVVEPDAVSEGTPA